MMVSNLIINSLNSGLAGNEETVQSMISSLPWLMLINAGILAPLNEEQLKVVLSWQEARNNKNFELADKLRQEIVEKGIEL